MNSDEPTPAATAAAGIATSTRGQRRRGHVCATASAATGKAASGREDTQIERATPGVECTRTYADGRRDARREFDNRLAFERLKKCVPAIYGGGAAAAVPLRPVMTRAEFIAAIRMRPRLDAPEGDGAAAG